MKRFGLLFVLCVGLSAVEGVLVASEKSGEYKKLTSEEVKQIEKQGLKKNFEKKSEKRFWWYHKAVSVFRYAGLFYPLSNDLWHYAKICDSYEDIDPRVAQILKGWAQEAGCTWAPSARIKLQPRDNAANAFYLFSPRTPLFLINREYWSQFDEREQRMIFLHECGHFENNHLAHYVTYLFATRSLFGGGGMKGITELGFLVKNHGRWIAHKLPFSLAQKTENFCSRVGEHWIVKEVFGDQFLQGAVHLGSVVLGLERPRSIVECALGLTGSFVYGAAMFSLGRRYRTDILALGKSHEWAADRFALDHARDRNDILAFRDMWFFRHMDLLNWITRRYAQVLSRMPQEKREYFVRTKYNEEYKNDPHPTPWQRMALCDEYLKKYPAPLPAPATT